MKNASLKQYFPLIPTRQDLLEEIQANQKQNTIFQGWAPEAQEEFLDFCTGVRGVKILYDGIFKEIMNPETAPEYLNELLSLLLGKKVEIIEVLPNDNSRIGGESSLLIMDIVVRLEDGSIADIEIQRLGYAFPGERSACYGADLLLRQYKRVRSQKEEKKFSYRDIKMYTSLYFSKKAPGNFRNTRTIIYTSFSKNLTLVLLFRFFRIIFSFPLTFSKKACTIKVFRTDWTDG